MRSVRRRLPAPAGAAVAAALAVAALGGALSACTSNGTVSGATGGGDKSAAVDGSTTPALPPGKYRNLPQPCAAVDLDVLHKLVPGAADYAGAESLTYDTDRRVGCAWHSTTTAGAGYTLSVDVERVVSYDTGVSDEVQAETEFEQRAQAASIALTPMSPTTTPPGTGSPSTATTDPALAGDPTGNAGDPGGDGSGTDTTGDTAGDTDSPDLAPRVLNGIGDTAFVNDVLTTPSSGPRRVVTLVFRTANVVASVTYTAVEPSGADPASSADLQKGAEQAAGQLEHQVEK